MDESGTIGISKVHDRLCSVRNKARAIRYLDWGSIVPGLKRQERHNIDVGRGIVAEKENNAHVSATSKMVESLDASQRVRSRL